MLPVISIYEAKCFLSRFRSCCEKNLTFSKDLTGYLMTNYLLKVQCENCGLFGVTMGSIELGKVKNMFLRVFSRFST